VSRKKNERKRTDLRKMSISYSSKESYQGLIRDGCSVLHPLSQDPR
jgi:hypothetical protein